MQVKIGESAFGIGTRTNLAVVTGLLLLVMGPCFGPVPRYLTAIMPLRPAVAWQLLAFAAALGIVFAWTWVWLRKMGRGLGDLGLGRPTRGWPVAIGVVVGVAWGLFGAWGYLRLDAGADLFEMSRLRLYTAVGGAVVAVFEDLITRGLIMEELRRLQKRTGVQVLASSLLFALYHSLWLGNLPGIIGSFVASLVYGLILSGLFVWGKRSLTPVIMGHSLALLVGEPFLSMSLLRAAQGMG